MSYETYKHLVQLLSTEMANLEERFHIACEFVSSIEEAHLIFCNRYAEIERMKNELHTIASQDYADHPNKEMRNFWGLE